MRNYGSMLAQAGANIGQQIGSGYANLGQDITKGLMDISGAFRDRRQQKEVQELLEKYKDDPAQLNSLSQKYAAKGDDALSKVFSNAAEKATKKNEAMLSGMELQRERGKERVEASRAAVEEGGAELERYRLEMNAIKLARRVITDEAEQEAVVSALKNATKEELRKFLSSGGKTKEGSKAAVKTSTAEIVENGQVLKYIVSTDPKTGEEVNRVLVGEVPQEEEETKDPFDSKWASDLLQEERSSATEAERRASDYALLEKEVKNKPAYRRGFLGSTVGAVEEAIGIAGAAQEHRRRITKIRTMGVLDLLPPGVASDKDVKLAMNAEIDPNNLSNEEAESYYRGMRLIAEAEREYHRQKVKWMTNSRDPNALGFDTWVQKEKANTAFEEAKTGPAFQSFLNAVTSANDLKDSKAREESLRALSELFPEEMKILVELQQAEDDWNSLENKPRGFN